MNRAIAIAFTTTMVLMAVFFWSRSGWILAKAHLAEHLIDKAWLAQLSGGQPSRPWPWADTWPVARLEFADEKYTVLNGGDGSALAFGPGLIPESRSPDAGTIMIAGHRDTHFRHLNRIHSDDLIRLQDQHGSWHTYSGISQHIIDTEQETLSIDPEQKLLILITCYPFLQATPDTPLRYVLIAQKQPEKLLL